MNQIGWIIDFLLNLFHKFNSIQSQNTIMKKVWNLPTLYFTLSTDHPPPLWLWSDWELSWKKYEFDTLVSTVSFPLWLWSDWALSWNVSNSIIPIPLLQYTLRCFLDPHTLIKKKNWGIKIKGNAFPQFFYFIWKSTYSKS